MLKRLVVLVLIVFFFLALFSGCGTKKLSGPTVTIYCLTSVDRGSRNTDSVFYRATFRYDVNGNLVDRSAGEVDDQKVEVRYEYYPNGIRKSVVNASGKSRDLYNEDGGILFFYRDYMTITYDYDEEGRICNAQCNYKNGDVQYYTYHYNSDGVLTRREWSRTNGWTGFDTYDAAGNTILEICRDGDEEIWRHENRYDDAGRLLKYKSYSHGELSYIDEYEYDLYGNQTYYAHYKGDKQTTELISEWEYDSNGHPVSKVDLQNGSQVSTSEWIYNSDGYKLVVVRPFGKSEIRTESTYTADGRPIELEIGTSHTYLKRFSYTAIQVPESIADQVIAQQQELIDDFDNDDLAFQS